MSDLFTDFRTIDYPIIDSDAHVQEPPDLWQSRAPASLKERAPKLEKTENGDVWSFDCGKGKQPVGFTAVAGLSYLDFKPFGRTYETIRPGCFDPTERLKDMDLDGIYAQVLYPSVTLTGAKTYGEDRDLQLFCVRAYNEWIGEFCESGKGRLFANSIIPTTGIKDAVHELEWSIKHGHKGAILSRMPSGGFDFSDEDEDFFALAEEADIPVAVHIGSFFREGVTDMREINFDELAFLGKSGAAKAGAHTVPVTCDLIFSGIFEKFENLKLVLVEANIGWIPTLLEQTDDMFLRCRWFNAPARNMSLMPSEIFHRNFWATFMVDTVGMRLRDLLNLDHLVWSTDYPHSGSDWPNSRMTLNRVFQGVPKDQVRKMLFENVRNLHNLDGIPEKI
ncbi:MAG: amidohydrolase [bacterium]|nr:amidohydrolase [bacterium]